LETPFGNNAGKQLGLIPNSVRVLSLSPAAFQGLLGLNGALGKALEPERSGR